MPRTLTRERPPQGARLVALRRAAGLSQYELARQIGEPQPNIAYWEQSAKPPRSDVLPRMAQALGVSVAELLGEETSAPKKSRPAGRVQQVFDDVSRLPRRQQEKIAEFVAAYVKQYEQSR